MKFYKQNRYPAWRYSKLSKYIPGKILDIIQDIYKFPGDIIYSIGIYHSNRFHTQTHVLPTGLEVGVWHEFETRLIHGMFDAFVEFIEREQAGTEKRDPVKGIEMLHWQINLKFDESSGCKPGDEYYGKPTGQAISAKEMLELYKWWKYQYPARKDLWVDISYLDYEKITKIEVERRAEDEEMMIRLIKLRGALWT